MVGCLSCLPASIFSLFFFLVIVVVVLMTQPEIGNGQHPHDNSGLSSSATTVCYLFRCSCCCCKSKKKKEQIPSLCSGISLISTNFRILFRCWRDTPGIQKQSTERHWQIKKSNGCATLLQLLYCTSTKGKASLFLLFDEGSIRWDRQDRLFPTNHHTPQWITFTSGGRS